MRFLFHFYLYKRRLLSVFLGLFFGFININNLQADDRRDYRYNGLPQNIKEYLMGIEEYKSVDNRDDHSENSIEHYAHQTNDKHNKTNDEHNECVCIIDEVKPEMVENILNKSPNIEKVYQLIKNKDYLHELCSRGLLYDDLIKTLQHCLKDLSSRKKDIVKDFFDDLIGFQPNKKTLIIDPEINYIKPVDSFVILLTYVWIQENHSQICDLNNQDFKMLLLAIKSRILVNFINYENLNSLLSSYSLSKDNVDKQVSMLRSSLLHAHKYCAKELDGFAKLSFLDTNKQNNKKNNKKNSIKDTEARLIIDILKDKRPRIILSGQKDFHLFIHKRIENIDKNTDSLSLYKQLHGLNILYRIYTLAFFYITTAESVDLTKEHIILLNLFHDLIRTYVKNKEALTYASKSIERYKPMILNIDNKDKWCKSSVYAQIEIIGLSFFTSIDLQQLIYKDEDYAKSDVREMYKILINIMHSIRTDPLFRWKVKELCRLFEEKIDLH